MTKLILAAVTVCAAVAAPATAAPFTPHLNVAYAVALDHWGTEPSNCTSLDKQIVPDDVLLQFNEGESTKAAATLATVPQPCSLWLARSYAAPEVFDIACSAIVHEVGHLLGYGHSDDPMSVMSPDGSPVGRCDRFARLAKRMRPAEGFPQRVQRRAARQFWEPLRETQ